MFRAILKKYSLPVILILLPACWPFSPSHTQERLMKTIQTTEDLTWLFPTSPAQINDLVNEALAQAKKDVAAILAVPDDQRTFENTAGALDLALTRFSRAGGVLEPLFYLSPDEKMRNAAQEGTVKLSQDSIDIFFQNKALYQAFKSYAEGNAKQETLTPEQHYFIDEALKDYKRAGLELPDETQEQVKKVQKELTELGAEFDKNNNIDQSHIKVTHAELAGLDDDFIKELKKEGDLYILGTDYPTYHKVMENATTALTREKLYKAYVNRAYPQNIELLNKIIEKRDQLAKLLGFNSYAQLDIDPSMAKTVQTAEGFIDELIKKATPKWQKEFKELIKELPSGVILTKEGKMQPWDITYTVNQYKKKHFDIDEEKVAEYFPMEHTVKALLEIYQKFFNLTFKEVPINGMWHDEVTLIEVYKNNNLIGYLLLDLYPRPNKYSHAAQMTIIRALKTKDGKQLPAVAAVMANLPKSTATKPSLLKRDDVETFFHEFGHAIHAILGATDLGTQSGTSVKIDFVELPSQMLEEWMWDKDILKLVSHHYKTGEPLPDELINKLLALKKFDTGYFVTRQGFLSKLALAYFAEGAKKDTQAILEQLSTAISPEIAFDQNNHFYTSFGHLVGYGSKYYGYLWSRVFAYDLFEKIKGIGLLSPEIGTVYAAKVIGKGGSKDPNELLKDFLGRAPTEDAFLRILGFAD